MMINNNILNKTKVYLCGPMQYSDGRGWRNDLTPFLKGMGVTVFDPYHKPFINSPKEDEETHNKMRELLNNGEYDEISSYFKSVRAYDLSMVDRSDFIICYLNTEVFTVGTIEEISWAVRLKRPTFIVMEGGKKKTPFWIFGMFPHKYIYDSFEDLKETISKINSGEKELDSNRWRLFIEELR